MSTRRVGSFAVVGCVVAAMTFGVAGAVRAQDLRGVRLRVDPAVFTYSSTTYKVDDAVGGKLELKESASLVGLFPNSMALGVGGSLNNTVNLGISLSFGASSSTLTIEGSDDEIESNATTYGLIPYIEAVFSPGSKTRPYIGAQLGITATTLNRGVNTGSGGGEEDQAVATAVVIGGDLGLHYFLNEHVSLTPHLHVRYASGSAGDVDTSRIEMALVLGLSAWIGDSKGEPPPTSQPAVPQESRAYAASGGHVPPGQMAQRDGSRVSGRFTTDRGVVDLMTDAEHPTDVLFRIRRYHGMNVGSALSCGDLAILIGGERHAISDPQHSEEREGPAMRETLQGVIGLDVLRELAPTSVALRRQDTIDVCGTQTPITLEARANINSFLRSVERMHRDYHVDMQPAQTSPATAPDENEAAPSASPTSESAPAPSTTQPPATSASPALTSP